MASKVTDTVGITVESSQLEVTPSASNTNLSTAENEESDSKANL